MPPPIDARATGLMTTGAMPPPMDARAAGLTATGAYPPPIDAVVMVFTAGSFFVFAALFICLASIDLIDETSMDNF